MPCYRLHCPTFVDNSLQFMLIDDAFMKQRIYVFLQSHYLKIIADELLHRLVFICVFFFQQELESPFKISGFIMSPLLSNIIRVVVLSLFSGVMSDILGFRLKVSGIITLSCLYRVLFIAIYYIFLLPEILT